MCAAGTPRPGIDQWGRSARVTARRTEILVGRVPQSVRLLCCSTSPRGQERATGVECRGGNVGLGESGDKLDG